MYYDELDKIMSEPTSQEKAIDEDRYLWKGYSPKDFEKRWNIESQKCEGGVYTFNLNDVILPEYHMFSDFTIQKAPRKIFVPEHRHDYIEMVYVYTGEFNHTVNGKRICVKQGEIFLMDRDTVHSVDILSDHDITINLLLSREFWDSILQSFLHDNDIFYRFIVDAFYARKNKNYLHFHCANDEMIQNHMKSLLLENYNTKTGSHSIIMGEFLIIFSYLLRDKNFTQNQLNTAKPDTWLNALNIYIKNNLNSASLTKAAIYLNFNSNYLCTLLKQATGMTFTQYLQDIKLKQVCFLLENTDYSIAEAAKEIGYSNNTYFYKIFTNKYCCTPREYRNKYQKS